MKLSARPVPRIDRRRLLAMALAGGAACLGAPRTARAAAGFELQRVAPPAVPAVPMVTMGRARTDLQRELAIDAPLWLNFVFTTCSTTCSMQTAVLASLQAKLLRDGLRTRFLSLTIDPDNDTPAQLSSFAGRFGIQQDWQFCTGTFDDMLVPQRLFDVYRGSKISHPPVVLLRTARAGAWWRITGFPTPDELRQILLDKQHAA